MSDQKVVNRIASRVRAALALIPHLEGPKEAMKDWILEGLREEYLDASDLTDGTLELRYPRILLSLQRVLTQAGQQEEPVSFEAIRSDDPLIRHNARYTEVDTDEEEDLGDRKWWMSPPEPRGITVKKKPMETGSVNPSVAVIPAPPISKTTAGSSPKPVQMKSAKISTAVPPALPVATISSKQSVKMKKSAQLSSAAAMIPSQVKSPVSPVPGPASPNVPVMLGKKKKKFKSRRIIMDSCDDDDDDDDVVVVESTQRGMKRKTDAEEEEEVKESLEVGKGKKSDLAIVKGEKMDIDPKEESYNQVCINCSTKGIDCAWPNIVGNKRVSERRACIQCSSTKVKCEVVGQEPLRKKVRRTGTSVSSRPSPMAGGSTDVSDRLTKLEISVQGYQKDKESILMRIANLEDRLKESEKRKYLPQPGEKK